MWEKPLNTAGHAGIAVNAKHCLIADRDPLDQFDHFFSLNPETGKMQWEILHPATGDLDYGNSSRSTPLLGDKYAWFQGAFGDCHCVDVKTGLIRWQQNILSRYGLKKQLVWGLCSSPLILNDQLILNPGGEKSSLISLDANSGKLKWKTAGNDFGYGSFIVAKIGNREQIIGHDKTTLGGWDTKTGARLWTITPKEKDDFNVPTPIVYQGKIIVATENNGTRIYHFDQKGKRLPKTLFSQPALNPETTTPVVANNRLFGICGGTLFCLELPRLKILWQKSEAAFDSHASLVADDDRVLIASAGELFLIDAKEKQYKLLSHHTLFKPGTPVSSHFAITNNRLYVRGNQTLKCFSLRNK